MKIGVLGGIGPEATGSFYNLLIRKLQQGHVKRNEDYPQIIINSINAPELVGEIADKDLEPYFSGLKELDMHEPDIIVMVCNTIHLFHKELNSSVRAEVLDLGSAVRGRIRGKTVVFGTPETVKRLYRLDNAVIPEEIEFLSQAIVEFNRGNRDVVRDVERIAMRYSDSTILLGCTEFAEMLRHLDIRKIDSVEVMVDEVVKRITA